MASKEEQVVMALSLRELIIEVVKEKTLQVWVGERERLRGRLVKEEEEEMVYSESWWKVMRGGDLGLM